MGGKSRQEVIGDLLRDIAEKSQAVLQKLDAWNHRRRFSRDEVTDIHKLLAFPTDLNDLEHYLTVDSILMGTTVSSSSTSAMDETAALLTEIANYSTSIQSTSNRLADDSVANAKRTAEINILTDAVSGAFDELGTQPQQLMTGNRSSSSIGSTSSTASRPVYASAEIPLALIFVILLIRAYWYYRQHSDKLEAAVKADATHVEELDDSNNGDNEYSEELRELELNQHLQTETRAKQALAQENAQLAAALEEHKATVEKFSAELQSRNERLSVFEKEQYVVKEELTAQIEILKKELSQRQQQQQSSLAQKENLCNDLVTKIQTLTTDLDQHEKLWHGIETKSKTKEEESRSKAAALEQKLQLEEQKRYDKLAEQEKKRAELIAKVQKLEQEQNSHQQQTTYWNTQTSKMEQDLEAQLKKEQAYCAKLNTKLTVFTSELSNREVRYTALENKTVQFEKLSSKELKDLQKELTSQLEQRDRLAQMAQEMQRALQEKQDQCKNLAEKLETSKEELKALDDRIENLAQEMSKRETNAAAKLNAFQAQLAEEKKQLGAAQKTTDETSANLKQKQEEFVNLTTRMDLFLKELHCRDEKVAQLEKQLHDKEELTTEQMKTLKDRLEKQVQERDAWNKTTTDLQQLLKDKKAQVVGLTTRLTLFERELRSYQDCVASIEAKMQEKEDAMAIKMEPLRREFDRLTTDRDAWKQKTEEIDRLLNEKTEQVSGLTTRVMLFRQEVVKHEELVEQLQETVTSRKDAAVRDMSPLQQQIESQREKRDVWQQKTSDIDRTLKDKQAQCIGLTTRVQLFQREIEKKEALVASIESRIKDKEETQGFQITKLKEQLKELDLGRDEWKQKTEHIEQMLREKEKECADLTAELKELVGDLQGYHQRRSMLESQMKEKEELLDVRMATLGQELQAAQQHRDKWNDTTRDLVRRLKETEASIVGLTTRSMLFKAEQQKKEESLGSLRKKFQESDEEYSSRIMQLQEELNTQREDYERASEETFSLNRELKAVKEQCLGLITRCKLFRTEQTAREQRVSEQEAKIADTESEKVSEMKPLLKALADLQTQRDDWKSKSEEIDSLVHNAEAEVIGLSTRLELFMTRLQELEENVSVLQDRGKSVRGMLTSQSLSQEVESAKQERDKWTESTIEIDQLLKDKKAQIVGLKTRSKLFQIELKKREEQVVHLQNKVTDKEHSFDEKLSPLYNTLTYLKDLRDQWRTTTENLNRMLTDKQEQCLPITFKLENAIDKVSLCKERIDFLEEKLQGEEVFASDTLLSLKKLVDEQTAELLRWNESTASVERLLKEKQQGVESLNTRLVVFNNELQVRDNAVRSVELKMYEREKEYEKEIGLIKEKIVHEQKERDRIIGDTMDRNKKLKAAEETCLGLSTRKKLFEKELLVRGEQGTNLAAKRQDKEFIYGAQMKALNDSLLAEQTELKTWIENTSQLESLLKERESECVGLSTRLRLFKLEEKRFNESVTTLEAKVNSREGSFSEQIGPLEQRLQQQQLERDSWTEKTTVLNGLLQEKKTEVVGLSTRSKLFKAELVQKEECVAKQQSKIKAREDEFLLEMEPAQNELKSQQEKRDAWEQSTQNIKSLLMQTEREVASIPVRLNLFMREQKMREDAVAELGKRIQEKDDVVAIELGFLLNELQLQQKQRAQWKKTTLDMHRLLKDTKEQCAKFTNKLESCKADLQNRQERVSNLEAKVRDSSDLTGTQLQTLRNELKVQETYRETLERRSSELSDLLEQGRRESKELAEKLAATYRQTEKLTEVMKDIENQIDDKKENASAQIKQLKEQLAVHLEQRNEWRENTMQMQEELKEKTNLCTRLKAKLDLLEKVQQGEAPTSKVQASATSPAQNQALSAKFALLEKELKNRGTDATGKTRNGKENLDVDLILKEKEEQFSNINSKLEALSSELMSL